MKPSEIALEALRIVEEHSDCVQWREFGPPFEHAGNAYEFEALHADEAPWEEIRRPVEEWPDETKAEVHMHICGILIRNDIATVDQVMRSIGTVARAALALGIDERFEQRGRHGRYFQTRWLQGMVESRSRMERSGWQPPQSEWLPNRECSDV